MKNLILFSFLIVGLFSCSQKKSIATEKSFKIIQKEATLKKGIQLRLKRVFDDSRCPEGAQCIWAGEVSIEIIVYKNKKVIEQKTMTFNSKNFEENKKWFTSYYKIDIKEFSVLPNLKDSVLLNTKDYFVKVVYE